ncbi:MAG: autoinducer binding domain-containing protein [Pseudorhodobacter sp.]
MRQTAIDDFLDDLAGAGASLDTGTAGRVWDQTAALFAEFGFDKLIYVDAAPEGLCLLTTLPGAWADRYMDRNYAQIDPFFSHCCATFRPVSTGVAYSDRHDGLTGAQMALIREASEFGINAGFSSTLRLRGDRGAAGWNIGSSLSRREVDMLRAENEALLRLAARHAHDILTRARVATCLPRLAPREVECLTLLAEGQRTKDIARGLGLSAAAVELYLRNARGKLGAATREQAVAMAAARGVLSG